MKIVTTADTHGLHECLTIPDADVLIVAGDICPLSNMNDIQVFGEWLRQLPHAHKIVIAGNHDKPFELNPVEAVQVLVGNDTTIYYLQDSAISIDGITFYGSPWTPAFCNWYFMADRGKDIREKWSKITSDVDVLITHGPPAGILDNVRGVAQGCVDLLEKVQDVQPKYHIFGHIHEEYGLRQREGSTYINASLCNTQYKPVNIPIEFEV